MSVLVVDVPQNMCVYLCYAKKLEGQDMKRHAPGLYTEGNTAISRECDGLWVERQVLLWVDGYPTELGDLGFEADTKSELMRMLQL
jgi:hypothetical protein